MKESYLWLVMIDTELTMELTALTVGENDHCNQNLLNFSLFLLVARVWTSVFTDNLVLFYITCTGSTKMFYCCRGNISYYLHDQISQWCSNDTSRYCYGKFSHYFHMPHPVGFMVTLHTKINTTVLAIRVVAIVLLTLPWHLKLLR